MSQNTPDMMSSPTVEPSAIQPGQMLTETRPNDHAAAASVPGAVDSGEAWTWFDEWSQNVANSLNRMRVDEAYRREIAARAK